MLVLTRKIGERIVIDSHIVIEVTAVQGQSIRLGIQAPAGVVVLRAELVKADSVSSERGLPN
jgi:carbon storage regulator